MVVGVCRNETNVLAKDADVMLQWHSDLNGRFCLPKLSCWGETEQNGLYMVFLPIADDGTKQPCCPVQLVVRVVMQEADFIVHAVDEALQQGVLPLIA